MITPSSAAAISLNFLTASKEEMQKAIEVLQAQVKEFETKITGTKVLVRTYTAGVHFGVLTGRSGTDVVLTHARRLYQWSGGALSLNEVSLGKMNKVQISEAVDSILLTQGVEIIPLSEEIFNKLNKTRSSLEVF